MDWAAMGMASGAYGAASSAYAEASRARAEVAALWEENQRLREDIDSQKYKQGFQQWVEELIYQFDKTVTTISQTPSNPVNDYIDLASFLYLIKEQKLDTTQINGLENKSLFERTLLQSQNLLDSFEKIPEVQEYIFEHERQQEEVRLAKERQQELARLERERLRAKEISSAQRKKMIAGCLAVLFAMLAIAGVYIDAVPPPLAVPLIMGLVFCVVRIVEQMREIEMIKKRDREPLISIQNKSS